MFNELEAIAEFVNGGHWVEYNDDLHLLFVWNGQHTVNMRWIESDEPFVFTYYPSDGSTPTLGTIQGLIAAHIALLIRDDEDECPECER